MSLKKSTSRSYREPLPNRRRKPTRAGWYWFRGLKEEWQVVRLMFFGSGLVVCDTTEGSTVIQKLKEWVPGEWVPVKRP